MKAVDGAAFIAMQPSAIGTKGYEVSERTIGVVPHSEDEKLIKLEGRYTVRGHIGCQ